MTLDPQTQGDARTNKHADVCKGHLPTALVGDKAGKRGCAQSCECWCHGNFLNEDGTHRDDAEALRAEIRRLNLESETVSEIKKKEQQN